MPVFIQVSPDIAEIVLLEDAIKNLDDQFLLVVVGEFNSGKSSFINAVLGQKCVCFSLFLPPSPATQGREGLMKLND